MKAKYRLWTVLGCGLLVLHVSYAVVQLVWPPPPQSPPQTIYIDPASPAPFAFTDPNPGSK